MKKSLMYKKIIESLTDTLSIIKQKPPATKKTLEYILIDSLKLELCVQILKQGTDILEESDNDV